MEILCPSDMAKAQRLVKERVEHYIRIAEKHYKRDFPMPSIQWSLKGKVAGRACAGDEKIWFHPQFMRENFDTYLRQTVGHEVAHLIQYWHFGYENNPSHGKQWKNVMWAFGLPANRCHTYDIGALPGHRKPKAAAPIPVEGGTRITVSGGVRIFQFA